MADSRDNLVGLPEFANQLLRCGVVDKVEHWAVTTDVEDGVEFLRLSNELVELSCVLPDRLVVLQKVDRNVILGSLD